MKQLMLKNDKELRKLALLPRALIDQIYYKKILIRNFMNQRLFITFTGKQALENRHWKTHMTTNQMAKWNHERG
jgi:hypothetical protein